MSNKTTDPNQPSDAWRKLVAQSTKKAQAKDLFVLFLDTARSVPMFFRPIPTTQGQFWMGARDLFYESLDLDSDPMTRVEIEAPYWMSVFPTTQSQWLAGVELIANHDRTSQLNPIQSRFQGQYLPVENVSWDDSKAWLHGLGQSPYIQEQLSRLQPIPGRKIKVKTTKPNSSESHWKLDLPTEAHWEWACRAVPNPDKISPFPWILGLTDFHQGDGEAALDEKGWYSANSSGATHRVGEKGASALKIHDLHGNVTEWCQDTWLLDYHWYWDGITIDQMLAVSRQKGDSQRHAIRGGSWCGVPARCRSADRVRWLAGDSYVLRGFRASLFFGPNDQQQGPTDASLDRAAQASSQAASRTTILV